MITTFVVSNVDDALNRGLMHLKHSGVRNASRNGDVIVSPEIVITSYVYPQCRVLQNIKRDANPFLHLFESLWILAGREDVGFLTMFAKRFAEFSDDGVTFHAPYGRRLRRTFGFDQIAVACKMLKAQPTSRRVVLQIWDANHDLNVDSKDLPCNDLVMCSLNPRSGGLDITVCCRSNDAIWGAYGANAVQFSMLQEYMANKIGVPVGIYTQISNNFHVYEWNDYWKHFKQVGGYQDDHSYDNGVVRPTPLLQKDETPEQFDHDIGRLFECYDQCRNVQDDADRYLTFSDCAVASLYQTVFFRHVVRPMLAALAAHKRGKDMQRDSMMLALGGEMPSNLDWFGAARIWFQNRDQRKTKQ